MATRWVLIDHVYTTTNTWMEKNTCLHGKITWQQFFLGEFSKGLVSWATSNLRTRDLAFGELQLKEFFDFFVFHLVCHTNNCLKELCPVLKLYQCTSSPKATSGLKTNMKSCCVGLYMVAKGCPKPLNHVT